MPWKFYGIAKIHKLTTNGRIDDLPLRVIVSNVDAVSYHLVKYLANLLSPLAQSSYTTNSTKGLMINIKNEKIPENYEMVSFDVKSLFTSVPLDRTIDINMKQMK